MRGGTAAVLGMLLTGCWLQPAADAGRTRWNPHEQEIDATNVASLTEAWTYDIREPGGAPTPVLSGGRVFFGRSFWPAGVGVTALDAESGDVVWETSVSPPFSTAAWPMTPPTFVGGELWVGWAASGLGTTCGTTFLDVDGHVVGEDRSGRPTSAPVQHGDVVLQALADSCAMDATSGRMLVRDVATREVRWTGVGTPVEPGFPTGVGAPAAGGDWIVAGGDGYPLAGCGAPTCSRAWQADLRTFAQPVVLDGSRPHLYTATSGVGPRPTGVVQALSTVDGRELWTGTVQSSQVRIALDDDYLYVGLNNEQGLVAYDRDGCGAPTCQPAWTVSVAPGLGDVAVGGDVVYVAGGDDRVHAFPADGCWWIFCTELASIPVPGISYIESMAIAEGRLVVVSVAASDTTGTTYRISAYELPG